MDAGTDAVGLHCENGNSPFWPDLTWFYCQQAPRKGSQTTICDGEQVLGSLSAQCRDFFESNDIRYSRTVPGEMWRRLVCHYSRTVDDPANVYFDDLLALVDGTPGTTITYNGESDAIHYSFVTSAIQISSFSNRPAFANSILGPSYNYEQPVIDTAAGIPIPTTFLDEVQDVSALATHPVGWQDNDTIVLDNRRVMHGRQAIIDMRRVIFNALSYR
ncbi:Taurine catabolism dioxygenase TauD, TfdA family [compost metagenome]